MTKKIIFVLAVVVVAVVVWQGKPEAQPQPTELDTTGWVTFRNDNFGYEINYPDNFTISGPSLDGSSVGFWNRPDYKDFFIPRSGGMRNGVYSISVTVRTVLPDITLNNYKQRKTFLDNAKKVLTTETMIDGFRAVRDDLKETGPFGVLLITYIQNDNRIYAIDLEYNFAADPDEAIVIYNRMVETFRFTR